jgi:hypothetical protein
MRSVVALDAGVNGRNCDNQRVPADELCSDITRHCRNSYCCRQPSTAKAARVHYSRTSAWARLVVLHENVDIHAVDKEGRRSRSGQVQLLAREQQSLPHPSAANPVCRPQCAKSVRVSACGSVRARPDNMNYPVARLDRLRPSHRKRFTRHAHSERLCRGYREPSEPVIRLQARDVRNGVVGQRSRRRIGLDPI